MRIIKPIACTRTQAENVLAAKAINPRARLRRGRLKLRYDFATVSVSLHDSEVRAWARPNLSAPTSYFRRRNDIRLLVEASLRDWCLERLDYPTKIFGIGFPRTGTSSLWQALKTLGLFGLHYAPWLEADIARGAYQTETVDRYTVLVDSPFPLIYKELDRAYPGSKFILTVRSLETWLPSIRYLGGDSSEAYRVRYYGINHYDESIYRTRYLAHVEEVKAYFADRPRDLLVLDVTRGEGYAELCDFLQLPLPDKPFPWLNRR